MKTAAAALALVALAAAGGAAARTLDIYFIDVEGGQATLLVTPAQESLLIDAGFAGFSNRDPQRILEAASDAGITHIDFLLITHFHGDHDGGVPELSRRLPIHTFVDYGAPVQTDDSVVVPFEAYKAVRDKAAHLQPKPGDRLPMAGVEVDVLTAAGVQLSKALPGAGKPNPACASFAMRADDPSENARSLGVRVKFGAFRFVDLGDLNWNPLGRLVCPKNLIGQTDLFLVPHHTNSDSNVPALLAALRPRVIVSNNGAAKGAAADALASIHHLPGVDDVWQLHRSMAQGAENSADARLANVDEGATGYWIKVSANSDGSFSVTNARTGQTHSYGRE
jgi:competence protein ComEC